MTMRNLPAVRFGNPASSQPEFTATFSEQPVEYLNAVSSRCPSSNATNNSDPLRGNGLYDRPASGREEHRCSPNPKTCLSSCPMSTTARLPGCRAPDRHHTGAGRACRAW